MESPHKIGRSCIKNTSSCGAELYNFCNPNYLGYWNYTKIPKLMERLQHWLFSWRSRPPFPHGDGHSGQRWTCHGYVVWNLRMCRAGNLFLSQAEVAFIQQQPTTESSECFPCNPKICFHCLSTFYLRTLFSRLFPFTALPLGKYVCLLL